MGSHLGQQATVGFEIIDVKYRIREVVVFVCKTNYLKRMNIEGFLFQFRKIVGLVIMFLFSQNLDVFVRGVLLFTIK